MTNTKEILEDLEGMVEDLRTEGGTHYKQGVLRAYPHCKEILSIIYNPLNNFYVTGKTVEKFIDDYDYEPEDIHTSNLWHTEVKTLMGLLNILRIDKSIRGNKALALCRLCIYELGHDELVLNILDKDLKCGISTKTINKVWPGLIPEFNVPLANTYKDGMCNFESGSWLISRKLDGIRCLIFIQGGEIKAYSRKGKEFFTLGKITRELVENYKGPDNIILDGEVCIVDEDGDEDFKSIISEIRKKDHEIKKPLFMVFDMYHIEDFGTKHCTVDIYKETYDALMEFIQDFTYTEILEQEIVTSTKAFESHLEVIPESWEGYILRYRGPTFFKRSNNLLKVKKFKDSEYTVIDREKSTKMIDGVELDCIGSIKILHKGNVVSVGSGLSDKQRLDWLEHPENILGKDITVKYFEESMDKEGNLSLRFPTLKHVWDEEKI